MVLKYPSKEVEAVDTSIYFKKSDLIPAIVQHYETKEVLMVGFVNEEALKLTYYRRPELLENARLDKKDIAFLEHLKNSEKQGK